MIGNENYSIDRDGIVVNIKTGKALKGREDVKGYQTIELQNEGKRCFCRIHRLLAENFMLGFYIDCHVHHKNGKKDDNRLENLEILSASEHNRIDMVGENNPMYNMKGEKNPKYKYINIPNLKRYIKEECKVKELAYIFNCSRSFVYKNLKMIKGE